MLKLEKTSDLSILTIRIREREGFFEPRLLKALAIALIFHSGAIFLFHVTPFFLSSTFTFPPIQVQSDQPEQRVATLVSPYVEDEKLLPPPLTMIPALDWISFSQESALLPSIDFDPYALQPLEEKIWPKWQEMLSLKLEQARIQLSISGDLAHLHLLSSDSLLNQMRPISYQESPAYVNYDVQLDEKTGELFWYERTQSSAEADIDQLTEKILLNLRFAPPESRELIKGTLHFVVFP